MERIGDIVKYYYICILYRKREKLANMKCFYCKVVYIDLVFN